MVTEVPAAPTLPPAWLDPALGAAWGVGSALVAVAFVATYARLVRGGRAWRGSTVDGVPVRVSPAFGPAVVGILRPAIVLPSALVAHGGRALMLALAHEREHIRGRDPLLLAAGGAYTALLPFSPAAWWSLKRLRMAVELDCDARVLRARADRRAYADLLLSTTAGGTDLPVAVPALLHTSTSLETRIRAMTEPTARTPIRAALATCASLLLVLGACEAKAPLNVSPAPEAEEVQPVVTEVAAADRSEDLRVPLADTTVLPDGSLQIAREMTAEEGAAERAAEETLAEGRVGVDTVNEAVLLLGDVAIGVEEVPVDTPPDAVILRQSESMRMDAAKLLVRQPQDGQEQPLIVVDGVIMARPLTLDLEALDIASVEVIKGAAAIGLYGTRAADGVINITTRAGGARVREIPALPSEPTRDRRVTTVGDRPLVIVDGVIMRPGVDLQALDIESVEIIKGAAARELYGSRAAAGVVVVTTKGG